MSPFRLYLLSSDFFWMSFGTLEKENNKGIFSHLLHYWRKFVVFENMERICQDFFMFIGSTTADPLFSSKMCRPCIIKQ